MQIDDGSNDSSWYQSHILGMNAAGELVIQWQRSVAPAGIRARFYTPDGSLLKTVELCPMYREDDAFRSRHVAAVVMGSDFLRFDGFDPGKVWRFSGQGEPLGCCRLPPGLKAGARLRSDGLGLLYLRDSGDAVKLVTLDFAQGCN